MMEVGLLFGKQYVFFCIILISAGPLRQQDGRILSSMHSMDCTIPKSMKVAYTTMGRVLLM